MHWTKYMYENKQRAITQKFYKQELRFMCNALPLDAIYPPTKFHNHSQHSFGDYAPDKEMDVAHPPAWMPQVIP